MDPTDTNDELPPELAQPEHEPTDAALSEPASPTADSDYAGEPGEPSEPSEPSEDLQPAMPDELQAELIDEATLESPEDVVDESLAEVAAANSSGTDASPLLTAPERLTIHTVSECREAWGQILSESPTEVTLDLSAIETADTAGWQLVEVFRRECARRGIELDERPCSEAVQEAWDLAIG